MSTGEPPPPRQQAHPRSAAKPNRLAALLVIGGSIMGFVLLSQMTGGPTTDASPSAASSPLASPTGALAPSFEAIPSAQASAEPSAPASPAAQASADPSPTAADPSPTAAAASPSGAVIPPAPTSADGFDLRGTSVDIAFPFTRDVRYRYRDRFLAARVGATRRFNHARGVTAGGRLLRAHDGVDIRAPLRTKVAAAFSGTVIDPATRWRPWEPERYGKVVAIVSDEPATAGYTIIYAHLAATDVAVGDRVSRGQLIGRVGRTGNARAEGPQLHVELRAPFRIPVVEGGRRRRIDAFDPLPSLRAADPRRRD